MKKLLSYVILICGCVALNSCIGWNIWSDSIGVDRVLNGNTLRLDNGINVVLLGIEDTQNSQQWLQKTLCPSGSDKKSVWFIKDSSYPDIFYLDEENNTFYAYVMTTDDDGMEMCLNSKILGGGMSDVYVTPYLQDSLSRYRQLVANQDPRDIVVNPVVNPVLDPDVQEIVDEHREQEAAREVHDHSGDVWMMDGNQNCEMLANACDYTNSITKSFANMLAAKSEGPYNVGQICEIYAYLRNKWKYVNDPKDNEYVAYASESIRDSHLSGDCDDFAVLMASCILAIGGEVNINTASRGNEGHAFTEVNIAGLNMSDLESAVQAHFGMYANIISPLATRRDGNYLWLNLDWQTSYPGGKYWLNQNYDDWNSYTRQNGHWTWRKLR